MVGIALLRMKAPRRRVQNVDFSGYFGIQVQRNRSELQI